MVLKEKQIFCAREGVPDRAVRAVDIGNLPIYAKVLSCHMLTKIYYPDMNDKSF